MCKILRILKNLFRFNHLEDVAQKVNANKTWRFFAALRLRGKACPDPPRRHEDAKNHYAFPIGRKILSGLRRIFGVVVRIDRN